VKKKYILKSGNKWKRFNVECGFVEKRSGCIFGDSLTKCESYFRIGFYWVVNFENLF